MAENCIKGDTLHAKTYAYVCRQDTYKFNEAQNTHECGRTFLKKPTPDLCSYI